MLDAIWTHVNGLPAIIHWQTKFHLSDQAWKQIDWDRLEQAYKESKEPVRCWAVKYMSFFGHGKNMKRWQYQLVSDFLHCGKLEDKAHITRCQQDLATETWDTAFKKLKQWFWESNTSHEVANAILWCLAQWWGLDLESNCPLLQCILEQELLGWDQFLEGWVVQGW